MSGGITQSGPITPGHPAMFLANGIVEDGGPPGQGSLTGVGITNPGGLAFAINSGTISGEYSQFGVTVGTNGVVTLGVNSFNGAPAASLDLILNGTTYAFPGPGNGNVIGPNSVTAGDLTYFQSGSGTVISDSGVPVVGLMVAVATITALRALTTTTMPSNLIQLQGYNNIADGGGGAFAVNTSDTTSADNGGTIIVDASGRRWYRISGGQPYSVKWFGAWGNNSTDDTTAINNTCTAAGDREVYFPAGQYITSSTITVTTSGQYWQGDGPGASSIVPNFASGDVIVFGNGSSVIYNCGIERMAINQQSARSSGAMLRLRDTSVFFAEKVAVLGGYNGISVEGVTGNSYQVSFHNVTSTNCANIAVEVGATGTGRNGQVNDFWWTTGAASGSGVGIVFTNASGVEVSNVDALLNVNGGILFNPSSSNTQQCTAFFMDKITVDTTTGSAVRGWDFEGTGGIGDIHLTACWGSSANGGPGFYFNGQNMDGITCVNCTATNNGTYGFAIMQTGNIMLDACKAECNSQAASGASPGIYVAPNVDSFQITNCLSGLSGAIAINTGINPQGYGIVVDTGTSNYYIITGNRTPGNTIGGILDAGSGTTKVVTNNLNGF